MNPGSKVRPVDSLARIGVVVRECYTFPGWYWVSWNGAPAELCDRRELAVVIGA